MEVKLNKDLFDKINLIIKYQNSLLLKIICEENNWNLDELKKKYLKKNIVKEKAMNKNNENVEFKVCRKIKIKVKKKRMEECYKFIFNNETYFINPKNNNAYNKKGLFLGVKEDDIINFDMEEIELK